MKRICIYPSDVVYLLGKSQNASQTLLRTIKDVFDFFCGSGGIVSWSFFGFWIFPACINMFFRIFTCYLLRIC